MIVFTICSNNYLAQASVLGKSLKKWHSNVQFFTILVDELSSAVDYTQLPFTCIPVKDIEPDINGLMEKYNIIELNTCVKPTIFQYFFDNYDDKRVVYFDPDIKVYNPLEEFNALFESYDVLLTPHILTPIPIDGKQPDENVFLNFGIYNLGFVAVQKSAESIKFIQWWKDRTYLNGYSRVWDGIFVDQLYINLVPVFFKGVYVFDNAGYNMAPWNLHERYLSQHNGTYIINEKENLVFFHFSSFTINTGELPVHYYDRFKMADRPDLKLLFAEYNDELNEAGYTHYRTIKCVYLEQYKQKKQLLQRQKEQQTWNSKSAANKLVITAVSKLSPSIVTKVKNILNQRPPAK